MGRQKDLIIRGGYNVYPREIEEDLNEHQAVAEVAVIGIQDEVQPPHALGRRIAVEEREAVMWSRALRMRRG